MRRSEASGKKPIKEVENMRAQKPKLERVSSELAKHKNTDEQLNNALLEWKETFDAISDWIAIIDLKGRILRTNRSGEDFTGISSTQIVGQSCCKLVHGSDEYIPGCPLQKMLHSRQRERAELKVPDTNRWLLVTVDPVTDKKGNLVGVVHITRDITERKRAEEAYRSLVDHSLQGLAIFQDSRAVFANQAMAEITGYTVEEMLTLSPEQVLAFVHPDDHELVWNRHRDRLNGEELPERYEFRGIRKDGSMCWIEIHASRIEYQGKPAIQVAYVDITERKQAEQSLQEAEAELKHTIEVVPCIIAKANAHTGYFTHCNPALSSMLGFSSEEFLARPFMEFIHPDDRQSTIDEVEQQLKGSSVAKFENRYICKDGSYKWLEWRATAADEKGAVYAAATDITERKRAEEAYRSLVDHSLQGLAIFQDGRAVFANQAMADIISYTVEEMLALPPEQIQAFVHPDDRELVWSRHRDRLNGEELPGRYEFRWVHKDGSMCWVEIHASRIEYQGKPAIQAACVDITERKQAEQALLESEERYRQLVSTMTDAMMLFDVETRQFIDVNEACEELYEYSREEFLELRQNDIAAEPEDSEDSIDELLTGQSKKVPVCYHKKKDGTVFPVEISGSTFIYGGRRVLCGIIRDITERKQAEEALRQMSNEQEVILDSVPAMIFYKDKRNRFLRVNKVLADIFGLPKEVIIGKTASEISPAEKDYWKDDQKVIKSGQPKYNIIEPVETSERTLWFQTDKIPYKDSEGNTIGIIGFSIDITERKKAEEAYRSLVDHSLQGLAIFQDGRVVFANQAMAEITGYTVEEMLTLSPEQVLAFVHPDDHELVWNRHRDRLNGEELPERYEFRGIRKDGSMCWIEIHASRIEYQGKPAIQVAYVDITEEKRAREALRETENSFYTSVENMLDCFGIYSAIRDESGHIVDFRIDYVNAAACAANFMAKNEQIGKRLCELLPAHRETGLFDEYCQVVETGKPIEKESLIYGDVYEKKHLIRAFDIRVVKLGDGYAAAWRDVTERKQAEDNLRESEEHYRMLAETMNDGLGQVNETGRYVYVNNKLGEMLGYSPDEMVGRHWTAFFNENAQKIINEQLTKRRKGISKPYELENTRKDGQKIFIHISPQAILDADGKFMGSFAVMTDITGRKRAEEQIARLAKFPAEDPNPVLRISGHDTVIYANKAGAILLKVWDCRVGKSLPEPWYEFVLDALSSGQNQQTEVQCDDRTFTLTFAPIVDANYVNVYGHDITERKRVEDERKRILEHIGGLYNSSPYPIGYAAPDGSLQDANDAFLKMTQYTKDELVGIRRYQDITPEEYSQVEGERIEELLRTGEPQEYEKEYVRKDGSRVPVLLTVFIVRDSRGEPQSLVAIIVDMTERKKAEQALREMASFAELNPAPVLRVDRNGVILSCNAASTLIIGEDAKEGALLGSALPVLSHIDLGECIRKGLVLTRETRVQDEYYQFVICGVPKLDLVNIYGSNITERKQAEEEILMQRNKLQAMLGAMDCGVTIRDLDYSIIYQNDYIKNIFGDRLGEKCYRVYGDSDKVCDGCPVELAYKDGKSHTTARKVELPSGEIAFFEDTANPIRDADGKIISCLEVVRDITARKEVDKKLVAYQNNLRSLASKLVSTEERQRRQIASDLHDNVSQVLALSVNRLRCLRKSVPLANVGVIDEVSQVIQDTCQNVRDLTFDLASPILYELGLKAAISEMLNEQLHNRQGIACKLSDDEKDKPLDDDIRVLLFQVVRELLINVAKHAKAHNVEVSIQRENDNIQIIISDDGVGFDTQKAETAIQRSGGFGLFNIRERLDYIGGSFEMYSQPSSGSRFVLTAPIKTKTD